MVDRQNNELVAGCLLRRDCYVNGPEAFIVSRPLASGYKAKAVNKYSKGIFNHPSFFLSVLVSASVG